MKMNKQGVRDLGHGKSQWRRAEEAAESNFRQHCLAQRLAKLEEASLKVSRAVESTCDRFEAFLADRDATEAKMEEVKELLRKACTKTTVVFRSRASSRGGATIGEVISSRREMPPRRLAAERRKFPTYWETVTELRRARDEK